MGILKKWNSYVHKLVLMSLLFAWLPAVAWADPAYAEEAEVKLLLSDADGTVVDSTPLTSFSYQAAFSSEAFTYAYTEFQIRLNGNYYLSAKAAALNSTILLGEATDYYYAPDLFPDLHPVYAVYFRTHYRASGESTEMATDWKLAQVRANDAVRDFYFVAQGTRPAFKVTRVQMLNDLEAAYGTPLAHAGLPSTVEIELNNGTTRTVGVTWDGGTPAYDPTVPGTYKLHGELNLPADVANPYGWLARADVIVLPNDDQPSPSADLIAMSLSEGVLSPVFASDTLNYTAGVPQQASNITVTASVYDNSSSVTASVYNSADELLLGPVSLSDGESSQPLPLDEGTNRIVLTATAQGGTAAKRYKVTVTRARAMNSNAYLQALQVSAGTLLFHRTDTDYTVNVGNRVNVLTVTALPEASSSTVTINEESVVSKDIPLNVGDNPVVVRVTAEDGISTMAYHLKVKRDAAITATPDAPIPVTDEPVTISVPSNVTNASIAVTPTTVGLNKEATLPFVEVQSATSLGNVSVTIQSETNITAPADWDGIIHLPAVKSNNSVSVNNANVSAVIEVGFPNGSLTFDRAVRLLIPNQGSKSAGYVQGGVFTPITHTITADTQAAADQDIAAGGEAKITVGSDLVIWTKHFTTFVSYTPTPPPANDSGSGNGNFNNSGNGGGVGAPANSGTITAADGGTLTLNGVRIEVPAGAVDRNIQVTVDKTSFLITDPDLALVSGVYEIRKDQDGEFSKPVVITLPFDKTNVDFAKSTVYVYGLNEQTGKWGRLDDPKVDQAAATVSGSVRHFTKFAVLASAVAEINPPRTSDTNLTDIKGHWAEADIQELVKLGAISGYPDNTFQPDNRITRAEFVSILVRAFHLEAQSDTSFTDTSAHWARHSIATAASLGIVRGFYGNAFRPDDPIPREQMAAMIVRIARIETVDNNVGFTDLADVSEWARAPLAAAAAKGLISGYKDGTVRPKANATRAEAAAVVQRALQLRT